MKKLKCTSCGGNLKVDENKEYATCEYCETKYKLNDDMTINIKLDDSIKDNLTKASKFMAVPIIIFAIIFITSVGIIITVIFKSNANFDKNRFNNQFIYMNGTQDKIFVDNLLDSVSESNKKNKRQVEIVYGEKTISDIIEFKHSLGYGKYEVVFNYDDKGFINKINIDKLD